MVVGESCEQILIARFMYGPFDMLTLTGEKVDIYVMTQPPSGDWILLGTEITSSQGRVVYHVPEEKKLGLGMYPVKMIVRYVIQKNATNWLAFLTAVRDGSNEK